MTTIRLTIPNTAILTNIDENDGIDVMRLCFEDPEKDMKVIYHKDCLDGTVASLVAWLMSESNCDVLPMSYQDTVHDDLLSAEKLYVIVMVDFCLPPDVLKALASHGHDVIVIDHHGSAIDKIMAIPKEETNFWYFLASENLAMTNEQKQSGGSLALKFFQYINVYNSAMCKDGGLERLVSLAREHDLWLHGGDPSTDAMALAYWHKNKCFEDLQQIWHDTNLTVEAVDELVAEGRVHLDKAVSEINEVIKCGCLVEINGNRAWLFYCERAYTSLAGSIVNRIYDIAISFYKEGDKFKMSIRTADGSFADASKLAAVYGGGGHKHAAGFYTDVYPAVLLKRSPPPPVALAPNVVINPNQA